MEKLVAISIVVGLIVAAALLVLGYEGVADAWYSIAQAGGVETCTQIVCAP